MKCVSKSHFEPVKMKCTYSTAIGNQARYRVYQCPECKYFIETSELIAIPTHPNKVITRGRASRRYIRRWLNDNRDPAAFSSEPKFAIVDGEVVKT